MAKKPDKKKKKDAPSAAEAARVEAAAGQDTWIACISYELESVLNGDNDRFDLTAYDGDGNEHGLNIRGKNDRPDLVQKLLGLLADWPDIGWEFQSLITPPGQVGTIVAVRKRP